MNSKGPTKGERTSLRILEAAATCIGEIGIEKTSITSIAAKAKVSRTLVAYHFPSKSEIFPKVVGHIASEGYKQIESFGPNATPEEKLFLSLDGNFSFFFAYPHYFRCLFLFYYYASIEARYRALNTVLADRTVARFTQLLTEKELSTRGSRSSAEIRRKAEELHRAMLGSIQKYFIVNHGQSADAYRSEAVRELVKLAE